MNSERVTVEVVVDIPPAQAWSFMSDFSIAHKYVPGIVKTEILEGPVTGVDAHRLVFDKSGKAIDETIIHWIENTGFNIRLHQGNKPLIPFKYAQFNYHMSKLDDESTLVQLAMILEAPWGLIGRVLNRLLFRPLIEKRLIGVAAGLKFFYESADEFKSKEESDRFKPEVKVVKTPSLDI